MNKYGSPARTHGRSPSKMSSPHLLRPPPQLSRLHLSQHTLPHSSLDLSMYYPLSPDPWAPRPPVTAPWSPPADILVQPRSSPCARDDRRPVSANAPRTPFRLIYTEDGAKDCDDGENDVTRSVDAGRASTLSHPPSTKTVATCLLPEVLMPQQDSSGTRNSTLLVTLQSSLLPTVMINTPQVNEKEVAASPPGGAPRSNETSGCIDKQGPPAQLSLNTAEDVVMSSFTNHDQLSPNGGALSSPGEVLGSQVSPTAIAETDVSTPPTGATTRLTPEKAALPPSQPDDRIFQSATFFVQGDQHNVRRLIEMMGGRLVDLADAQFVVLSLKVGEPVCQPHDLCLAKEQGVHPLGRVVSREWVTECWSQERLVNPAPFIILPPGLDQSGPAPRLITTAPTPPVQSGFTANPQSPSALEPVVAAFIASTGKPGTPAAQSNCDGLALPQSSPHALSPTPTSPTITPCPRPRETKRCRSEPPRIKNQLGKPYSTRRQSATPSLSPAPSAPSTQQSSPLSTPPNDSPRGSAAHVDPADLAAVDYLITSLRAWLAAGVLKGGKLAFIKALPRQRMTIKPLTMYRRYQRFIDDKVPELREFKPGHRYQDGDTREAKRIKM